MAEPIQEGPAAPAAMSDRMREVARLLREADHLGPEEKEAVARLADELAEALRTVPPSSPEAAHLTESAAHLIEALHRRENKGVLAAARDRLEESVLATEARSPFLAGIAHRLVEALASLGI